MTLRQTTREIIKLVEEKTGYPVQVSQDPNLPTIATIHMARGNVPAHLLVYKPQPGKSPDYPICLQCAFTLRQFETPPDQRVNISSSPTGQAAVESMLNAPDGIAQKYNLHPHQVEELTGRLLSGLIIHLRSIPVGLRAGLWLSENYPNLKSAEEAYIRDEFELTRQTLSQDVRDTTPPGIYNPTLAINAAHALFWSQTYPAPDLLNALHLGRHDQMGRQLLDIWKSIPTAPAYDRELIDAWAEALNVLDWYTWVPHITP